METRHHPHLTLTISLASILRRSPVKATNTVVSDCRKPLFSGRFVALVPCCGIYPISLVLLSHGRVIRFLHFHMPLIVWDFPAI